MTRGGDDLPGVHLFEVREAVRPWLPARERAIQRMVRLHGKTVRRYVSALIDLGLARDGNESQLTDEVFGSVVEVVRPDRRDREGDGWRRLVANHDQVRA